MTRRLADDVSWWNNGEANDYDIYTTSNYLITILLPENTRALSFSIGANLGSTSNNAWLTSTSPTDWGSTTSIGSMLTVTIHPALVFTPIIAMGVVPPLPPLRLIQSIGEWAISQSIRIAAQPAYQNLHLSHC